MAITSNPTIKNGAVITAQGTKTFFNISANTLVKATAGRLAKVSVIVAGDAAGTVHDSASIAGAGTANALAIIPNTVGVYNIDMPVSNGIVVKTGTNQVVMVSYI